MLPLFYGLSAWNKDWLDWIGFHQDWSTGTGGRQFQLWTSSADKAWVLDFVGSAVSGRKLVRIYGGGKGVMLPRRLKSPIALWFVFVALQLQTMQLVRSSG